MSDAIKLEQHKMVPVPEAIEMVSKIIARNNPYKGDEFTAHYNRKIRNQALRFIEQVLVTEDIDRELNLHPRHIEDLWEVYLGFGETRYCSLSESVIDLNCLEELAQDNFCPILGNIQPEQCNTLPEAIKSAEKKRSSPSSALVKDDSDGAKKLANKCLAEREFENTCPELSQKVLASYKSTPHSSAGKQKGKAVEAVKKLIQEEAERQLDAGCKCQHSELAEYLKHMKRGDGNYAFPIPNNRNKPSIKESRWFDHVLEATTAAFRAKNIPLRNESKTEKRGRALCEAHRDWTIPPASQ